MVQCKALSIFHPFVCKIHETQMIEETIHQKQQRYSRQTRRWGKGRNSGSFLLLIF